MNGGGKRAEKKMMKWRGTKGRRGGKVVLMEREIWREGDHRTDKFKGRSKLKSAM